MVNTVPGSLHYDFNVLMKHLKDIIEGRKKFKSREVTFTTLHFLHNLGNRSNKLECLTLASLDRMG